VVVVVTSAVVVEALRDAVVVECEVVAVCEADVTGGVAAVAGGAPCDARSVPTTTMTLAPLVSLTGAGVGMGWAAEAGNDNVDAIAAASAW
jgi:hypothetical protein